jgi:predicted DNA-binding transcriptional regulator YafY
VDKIILKYQSSKKEITEREISNISSKIADNMNKIIYAYCHLRDSVRSFNLDNILEIKINETVIDKDIFWENNLNDKINLLKDLDKMLKKKKKEYDDCVLFVESMKNIISKI